MTAAALTLHAPAKVNLALSVGALDPGPGLHPVGSWMVSVGFGDRVRLGDSELWIDDY